MLQLVAQDHQLRDHRVKAEALDVLTDTLDGRVYRALHIFVCRPDEVLGSGRRGQVPDIPQQVSDCAQRTLVDRTSLVPRPEKRQPAAYGIGA